MGEKTRRSKHKIRKKEMRIQLWYSKPMKQWRWTLTSDVHQDIMESGSSDDLRVAMNDVAITVEWLLDKDSK